MKNLTQIKKSKSHGMSSSKASHKKQQGHKYESIFAKLINGKPWGHYNDKTDVRKGRDNYSVKAGKRSQIFLYSKSKFERNTEFRGLDINQYFIKCLSGREHIIPNMKKLKKILDNQNIREAFFSKAFFNSNEVNKLAILCSEDNIFYIFKSIDCLKVLTQLVVENSMGEKKVIFKSDLPIGKRNTSINIGELEVRSDKNNILFVFNLQQFLQLLRKKIDDSQIIKIHAG